MALYRVAHPETHATKRRIVEGVLPGLAAGAEHNGDGQ